MPSAFENYETEQTMYRVTLDKRIVRAAMMTSFAFIAGLIPLVTAEGASMLTRRAVGTGVAGGMLTAAAIGIFVIPALYVVSQSLRERIKGTARPADDPPAPAE